MQEQQRSRRGLTLEEIQPDYDSGRPPKTLTRTRHIDDVLYVAGRPPVSGDLDSCDVMIVAPSVDEDEAAQQAVSVFGFRINQPAEYLKGATGVVKDVALRAGLDIDRCYYTAVCKWLLPRAQRSKPPKKVMRWGMPVLESEIAKVKPKVIVCMGKPAFDMLSDVNVKFADAHGCWFWSERFDAQLYVMHAPYTLVSKPDFYETFRVDFKEVAFRLDMLRQGIAVRDDKVRYQVISSDADLMDWLDHLEQMVEQGEWPGLRDDEGNPLLAVDCEWHGRTHVDGQLRTIQFAWSESDAVVIEFLDEETAWSFQGEQTSYKTIGARISSTMERIKARYIGHHFAADAPWMEHVLGIDTYGRCEMDTEFAQQTIDEASELGLERGIAMKYTNLGRYDQDLVMWKRDNRGLCAGGYGFVPSDILHPYGARDVIVPYRAYPAIRRQMDAQRLWDYYRNIFNPFVTDVFTGFAMVGLPMDVGTMDELREILHFTKGKLEQKLQRRIADEAKLKLQSKVLFEFGAKVLLELGPAMQDLDHDAVMSVVKRELASRDKLSEVPAWLGLVGHFVDAPAFNIRSPDQMRRWLFDVEGLVPLKSTNQKAKGLPSMAWDAVLELPADRRSLYTPAVDKQTLQILSEQLPTLDELLDLNAVGNLAKAFLRQADMFVDPDTDEEEIREHGLHSWLAADGRIHCQYSTTETGRPRSWAPNTLNWPSVVSSRIARSVAACIQEAYEEGDLPDNLRRWVGVDPETLPSIRSCVKAPPGYVLVESDYATAEMVALYAISGDDDLRRLIEDPDPDWALLKKDNPLKAKMVRIGFSGEALTGIPESACDPRFIMSVWYDGECLGKLGDEWLLRDDQGNPVLASYDIHWSLIERTYGKCRESMAKKDRQAAKVLNFSSAYGATANSLERKIEADTGSKPEPGVGERGLAAIAARQPRATEFLEEMARVPKERGFYRAASGRIRHCVLHGAGSGVGWRTRNALESSLGREMRNFPMQESVGATSARACRWLLGTYRMLGMEARPMTCLYDSVVTLCPLEERFLVSRLHELCMSELNTWEYDDAYGKRTLRYRIDNEFKWRWSTDPSEEDAERLADRSWYPPGDRWDALERFDNLGLFVS
jgi:uracil-DNA glycosylase family 4